MALAETKFRLSRIVLSAAVFISLCVLTPAEEVRRCYWCGPLAEQVHRSQRAPPCASPYSQVTVCDPGFPYCAVVATSPPYTESRYCVKMYQDECYSLYCNSSKTWRMTCPCRGDLCNGPNTDREDDAFGGLAKIVAKAQNARIKRALISTSGFISMNTNTKNRIENNTFIEENKNTHNETMDNNINEEVTVKNNENQVNESNTTTNVDNKELEKHLSDTMASTEADVKSDENQMDEISPTPEIEFKNNESQENSTNITTDEVDKTSEKQINETSIQIDIPSINAEISDLKTEIILMSSETTKLVNDTKASNVITNIPELGTSTPEMTKQTAIELKAMVETSTEAAKATPKEVEINEVKPSEQLPTAEALQHNDTPTTKTTEQFTTSKTVMSIQHTEVATESTKPRNNTAARIDAQILTLVVGIILHY